MLKTKKVFLVGNTTNARLVKYYLDIDSEYEVVAFVVNRKYIDEPEIEGLPVIPFEEIIQRFPPSEYFALVAIGYKKMNKIREQLYLQCKGMGYTMASYISSHAIYLSQFQTGDNCLILEGNIIQPYVRIGNNVVIWSGNNIAHHAVIEDHCYITTNIAVSGKVRVMRNCFIGTNSTLNHNITLAPETLVGAGSIVMKDTLEKEVYLPSRSVVYTKSSDEMNQHED